MILVECYLEEALVRALGFMAIRHEANKPAAIRELERLGGAGQRVVGLVDEDPGAAWPRCFRERFSRVRQSGHGFSVWRGPGNAYLIVLHPFHEAWVYGVARRHGLDVSLYGLPLRWETFHARLHVGRRSRERLTRSYVRLISDLLERGCEALISLKSEIKCLLGEGGSPGAEQAR